MQDKSRQVKKKAKFNRKKDKYVVECKNNVQGR